MSSSAKYWQPPGLSALQLQLGVVLRDLDAEDYASSIEAMKRLAVITSEVDIVSIVEKFCSETDSQLELNCSARPLTHADRLAPFARKQSYLKERSYQLLKTIMLECSTHGITLKQPRDLASNSNRSSQLFEEAPQASL